MQNDLESSEIESQELHISRLQNQFRKTPITQTVVAVLRGGISAAY